MKERNILIISFLMVLITLTGLVTASVSDKTNLEGDQSSATITLQSEDDSERATPILILGDPDISVSGRTIDFYAKTYSFPSVSLPTVQATAELYYKPTSSGSESFKISASKTGTYVKSIKASGFYVATQSGYYRVVGHHRIVSPAGYTPAEVELVSHTDWTYVSV